MSDLGIDIRGIPELKRSLAQISGAGAKRTLQKASTAGAKALKPYIQKEAPVGPSGNRYTKRGALRRSVSSRQASHDRPAAVVSARPRVAFYRHMVIKGTKPHNIRTHAEVVAGVDKKAGSIHHPGSKANPFVDRGFERGKADAIKAVDQVIEAAVAAL